ncbi:hypothetical protein [Allostreptomyces psammosilenae]|uniref:Uncharacterized protein n=1 Tax=Allostreptomyces psammosilenae TaxID=1892865 RepID=A0A853A2V4_9ACTN|nr:hypothetical protein [Allostreptomyces psammosilenae]NYI08467.1 hypothetical protein [Allostreptomyces psammosilenae]
MAQHMARGSATGPREPGEDLGGALPEWLREDDPEGAEGREPLWRRVVRGAVACAVSLWLLVQVVGFVENGGLEPAVGSPPVAAPPALPTGEPPAPADGGPAGAESGGQAEPEAPQAGGDPSAAPPDPVGGAAGPEPSSPAPGGGADGLSRETAVPVGTEVAVPGTGLVVTAQPAGIGSIGTGDGGSVPTVSVRVLLVNEGGGTVDISSSYVRAMAEWQDGGGDLTRLSTRPGGSLGPGGSTVLEYEFETAGEPGGRYWISVAPSFGADTVYFTGLLDPTTG